MVATLAAVNTNVGLMALIEWSGGVWNLESGGLLYGGTFRRNLASVAV
jgi:hypothetical protein